MDNSHAQLLTVEKYGQVIDLIERFVVLILRRFLQHEFSLQSKDNSILRNSLSRMAVSLRSIMVLFKVEDFHNCWVIIVFKENPRPRHFGFFSPRGLKWGYIRESKG
jgi:hypothetical protein